MSLNRKRRTRYYALGTNWNDSLLGETPDLSDEGKGKEGTSESSKSGADDGKGGGIGDGINSKGGINNKLGFTSDILSSLFTPNKGIAGEAIDFGKSLTGAIGSASTGDLISSIIGLTNISSAIADNYGKKGRTELDKFANPGDELYNDPSSAYWGGFGISNYTKQLGDLFSNKSQAHDWLSLIPFFGTAADNAIEAKENRAEAVRNKAEYEAGVRAARTAAKIPAGQMAITSLNSPRHQLKSFFKFGGRLDNGGTIGEKEKPLVDATNNPDDMVNYMSSAISKSTPLMVDNHDKYYDYLRNADGSWMFRKKGTVDYKPINAKGAANMENFINGKPDIYKVSSAKSVSVPVINTSNNTNTYLKPNVHSDRTLANIRGSGKYYEIVEGANPGRGVNPLTIMLWNAKKEVYGKDVNVPNRKVYNDNVVSQKIVVPTNTVVPNKKLVYSKLPAVSETTSMQNKINTNVGDAKPMSNEERFAKNIEEMNYKTANPTDGGVQLTSSPIDIVAMGYGMAAAGITKSIVSGIIEAALPVKITPAQAEKMAVEFGEQAAQKVASNSKGVSGIADGLVQSMRYDATKAPEMIKIPKFSNNPNLIARRNSYIAPKYAQKYGSTKGYNSVVRHHALGGDLSNVPDENAVPIDENAELMVNDEGGTSGSHEQGDNIPVYNQGQGTQMVEPGEVIVEMPDGTQQALSKRLGIAQKYLELSEQKKQLEQQLQQVTSTDEKGTITKYINDIQAEMMKLPEEQEQLKLMYGLESNQGEAAYGFNTITSGINDINLDGGETPEERRRRRAAERKANNNSTIEDFENEDLNNNLIKWTELYPDLTLPDSWNELEAKYGVSGADYIASKGFKAGSGEKRTYIPGTLSNQKGSATYVGNNDVLTNNNRTMQQATGIKDKDGNWITEVIPGEARDVNKGDVENKDKPTRKLDLLGNLNLDDVLETARFIDNVGNAQDIKKIPQPWKPVYHTPHLIGEDVNTAESLNALKEQTQNVKGSLRRNAMSIQDIAPTVAATAKNYNDAISKVNSQGLAEQTRRRGVNHQILDNASMVNEGRLMDYNGRLQAAKEEALSLSSANRANMQDDIVGIINNRRLDKYQQQQLMVDMLGHQDTGSYIESLKNGLLDKLPITQSTLDEVTKDLKDANGNIIPGKKDEHDAWVEYAKRKRLNYV